ncbi:SDR family NAD(P)-dependent oxidoreductase [Aliiruegeria lutimaris]|uniref:3-oxoacyl-[acyl-carrier protein] reductase n=1 Tax=Aliiruegeria lutimaris TaxID=571298 RepID=A0A1G8IGQ5_9RHOB|nr:3-oxoacyl-ACP reductase family protein [Aliiruegeria lutimaris]SDI18094.1 3-oxoacyl-[acyl-carrier protein] reductase [Aliiruegeria lutimaris]
MTLQGKVALVTGGSRGIGRAIAEVLTAAGAKVAICHADDDAETVPVALSVRADVSSEADVISLFDRIEAELGTPEIVVNNAGILHEAPLAETTLADFDRVIAVNLRGGFLVAREAARRMESGRILNIASDLGLLGRENMAAYSASKGGIIALTRSMARELAPKILVNAIAPGPIDTDMTSPGAMSPEALAKDLDTPLARFGRPEEVAALATFLAGPQAGFITGQCYGVNGGSVMT